MAGKLSMTIPLEASVSSFCHFELLASTFFGYLGIWSLDIAAISRAFVEFAQSQPE